MRRAVSAVSGYPLCCKNRVRFKLMWHQSRQPAMGCVLGRGNSRIARAIRESPLRHISLNRTRKNTMNPPFDLQGIKTQKPRKVAARLF
jgi:hypothetical protein